MHTYEDIKKASESIILTPIKDKDYVEVTERVKIFRTICPMGSIETELVMDDGAKCIIRATVKDETGRTLSTGTAYELKDSNFINKTSYIENCETSAVGRALSFCGIGIDTSIASADEVLNAKANQNKTQDENIDEAKTRAKALEIINKKYGTKEQMQQIADHYGVEKVNDMTTENFIDFLKKQEGSNGKTNK